MKRGITLFAVMMLLVTVCTTAMAQGKSAPAGLSFGTGILRDTTAAEQPTEAAQESEGMTMWDLTLIGLGIAVGLLVILLLIAVTSKKEVEREYDVKDQKK